jgi:hypothetical protein
LQSDVALTSHQPLSSAVFQGHMSVESVARSTSITTASRPTSGHTEVSGCPRHASHPLLLSHWGLSQVSLESQRVLVFSSPLCLYHRREGQEKERPP